MTNLGKAKKMSDRIYTKTVLNEVYVERIAQQDVWGERDHDPLVWGAILGEEVGELAQAMLLDHEDPSTDYLLYVGTMRKEAIQVAAVAVAFVEYLNRMRTD